MAKKSDNKVNVVLGTVTNRQGRALANLIVKIYDRDMRSEEVLGETVTNKDGKYEVNWQHEQLKGRGKKGADIMVKVYASEKGALLFNTGPDSIIYNASSREEVNITIQGKVPQEDIEFDRIVKEVEFLANKVEIVDLREDKEHHDISFLVGETGYDADKIEHVVVAHRLEKESKIDAPFFYALLRQQSFFKADISTLSTRLSINTDTDTRSLLFQAALIAPAVIQRDVEAAVESKMVDGKKVKVRKNIETLSRLRNEATEYFRNEFPQKAFESVTRFVMSGKIQAATKLFDENKNDLDGFFRKLVDSDLFENEKDANDAETNLKMGKLFGFGNNIIPHLLASKEINRPDDIKKLAKLNKKDWEVEFRKASGTEEGNDEAAKAIGIFSSLIVRKMERTFPTAAFSAQLARESKVLKNQEPIINFFNKFEDFDLVNSNVDLFLKEKKVPVQEGNVIKEELKSMQRIFKLAPQYKVTKALLSKNIHSAQSIARIGETRFIKEVAPNAGISSKEAKEIFAKANRVNTAAMLLVGELQDTMRAVDIASIETSGLAKKLDAVSKDFPNLKSLFKIADACACEHCRSVYSPAAYLVEILQFIKDRSVTDVTTTPATPNKLAKEVLFARRPDLGEIDLGCENANTPVKYIDLVCELLEEAIAPDAGINFTGNLSDGSNPLHGKISADLLAALEAAGLPVTNDALIFESEVESASADALPHYLRDKKVVCKIEGTGGNNFKVFQLRQTLSSAEELAAAPEYVNTAAYTELSTKKYAFKLPFDLNHAEASAYFNRFDLSRAQLMKDFQVANVPADAVIAAERLGLTSAERDLIIKLRATTAEQQEIWNAPAQWDEPPVTGDVLVYMKRVDHFLDKTNVDYKGLDLLLLLKYIDPADNLFIKHLDESCQTEKKEIANFDLAALDRLHRFLRLQKKTGWKFEVLDEIIMQPKLGAGLLDDGDVNANGISNGDECLINAARLSEISTKINLKIDELIGFYGEIPHTIIKEDLPRPLYYQLFLNKAKNGFIDGGLLPENVDGTQPIANVKDSIAVCLQLKLKDLEKLLVLLPDQQLRFSNLSFLFGASRLIRKLKVKIDDFINLFELTGINFSESPQKTMEFIEAVETFRKSPHKTSDVKFYLRHEATVIPSIDDKINQLLVQLQQQYVENLKVNGSKFDDKLSAAEQKATIQSEISKLSGVAEDDVKKLLSFVDRDWTLAADAKDVVSNKLNAVLSAAQVTTINGKIDVLDAAALTNFTTERNDLADTFIGILDASVVLGGLNFEQKRSILQGLLSKLDVVNENDVFAIINFIDFRRISNVEAKQFADDKFEFDVTAINTAIDNLFAANNAAKLQAQKDVVKELLNAFGSFQLNSGKKNILEQVIATSLKGEGEMVKVILKFARLKQPVQANPPLLSTILQSDALIQMTGVPPVLPDINNVDFPEQYAAIKLLSKLIPFIVSLKLSVEDAAWFFEHNKDLGWFEPDTIPYTSGQINGDYAKYIAFVEVASLLKLFEPVPDPADPQISISFFTIADMLLLPVGSVTKAKFIETLSLLTGYDKDNLDAIDTHLLSPFAIANYKEVSNWNNVIKCAEHLRVMGADTAQVKEYIKEVLLAADVRSLRTLLKSRYDEDTWLSTLKEIMDAIRPRKRNALVAHLLAGNPEMKDENDLFDYFLIDVEMESCMPSSRIVQAHGTVQLFVTRCLMGLEPKAAADIEHDKSWNRWKWMKNYRVWEANRKVFLYPENWIEAELRDDKSFLFAELENEIQQNELNEFTAEEALRRYLEKLDNIAFLEVMASWYQTDIKTMHVFARTKGGDPGIYYYRRFEKERYWTPWEKVDLDITGDHLLAFVRNNRLCLAWPVFSELEDPNQGATIPNQTLPQGTEQPVDRPRKKLKIQIAISEFANKKWQPKRISKEGILTPHVFTTNSTYFRRDIYYFTYFPLPKIKKFAISDIICVFAQPNHKEFQDEQQLIGVFNVAGCKGYPELLFSGNKNIRLPDFLPDFNDTALLLQRYKEQNGVPGDDLSVRNGVTIFKSFNFLNLLAETPGIFRISFPHQFTKIDIVSLLFQLLLSLVNNSSFKLSTHPQRRRFKIPMGTLLPYFKEDSNHAYVIIPGFYKKIMDPGEFVQSFTLSDEEKRTASDALKLLEDLFALIKLYIQKFKDDPAHDINLLLQQLVSDEEFHRIIKELTAYEGFDPFYNFLIGKTGNADLDKILAELRDANGLVYGEQFKNMYHPLVCYLRSILYRKGIPELMKRDTQLHRTDFDFESYYTPNHLVVPKGTIINNDGTKALSYPVEDVDFTSDGSYSVYNWELFFHVPFLLATRLTRNQKFEEAMAWFHYIFNPTGALPGTTPQKYWVTKPFFLTQDIDYISQRIDKLLYKVSGPDSQEKSDLEFAIDQWRDKPFRPHVVARFRPVAYQKAVLMKYIDNLTEWGDYLFRQDTMESIVQATQMYILADKLLGPKPRVIPPLVKPPYETYNQIENKLDAFGNALIDLENIIPDVSVLPEGGEELPTPITLSMLYFCIPQNDKMLEYWDRIADRLFKIRHCQNIDGIERSLALFAPPIDPGALVRAVAGGLDISDVLSGINAPVPCYRFNTLSQKATDLIQEVRGVGNSLLLALEKKDAETLALLRSELEIKLLKAVKDLKVLQIKEAKEQIEILKRNQKIIEERIKFYSTIQKINVKEQLNLDKLAEAHDYQHAANITYFLGAALALIPDLALGASGFGGSPHGAARFGGSLLSHGTDAIGKGLNIFSAMASFEANRASILGGYERRFDDWKFQQRLATKDLLSTEKQIVAAEIRKEVAETDLRNHELQTENAGKVDEFMRSRFTNEELYSWMIGQFSSVYFSAYQLSHDLAKKAERSYRFELGNDDSFISYGYWDSMKKGLLSAEKLMHDLKRMEASYLDKNKREFEIIKHVSVALLDPLAIVRLSATGSCDFDIPEALYDMDHPGQYFRRIKSIGVSLPCIAGPYTSVSAKLSLVNNRYRKNTNVDNAAGTGYTEDPGNDERFVYNVGSIQSIATSTGQNDSGMFELNFRDERFLPFENTGAISSWRLELPATIRQFDYSTISDVIIHVRYTSRDGGSGLRTLADTSLAERLAVVKQQLNQEGLHIAINMKHDLPNEWHLFLKNGTIDLTIDKGRLPYIAQTLDAAVEQVMFVVKAKNNPANFSISIDGTAVNLARINEWEVCKGINADIDIDTTFTLFVASAQLANIEEVMMVVKYSF